MHTYKTKALLVLENGDFFEGVSVGADCAGAGELIFNTAMSGYQEVLTDPSYAGQVIVFTTPHIGNVGVNRQDEESPKIWASGVIIRDFSPVVSNWRAESSLEEYFQKHRIPAIVGVDTRKLTACIRENGIQRAFLIPAKNFQAILNALKRDRSENIIKKVSANAPYSWFDSFANAECLSKTSKVVVFDFGVKYSILKCLAGLGCIVTVVPASTSASEVLENYKPNLVIFSNGPGDPAACHDAIDILKDFLERNVPVVGICLGHQLLALATGAKTIKMKYGHHGVNHPVMDLKTQKVFMTSQNHNYAVDEATLPSNVIVTHKSLFDGSVQGIELLNKPAIGFQGHPEASPGTHDFRNFFLNTFFKTHLPCLK